MARVLGYAVTPPGATLTALIAPDGIDDELHTYLTGRGTVIVPLISQRDAEAEMAKLRALLVRAREGLARYDHDACWATALAIDAALAETEGAT